MEQWPQSGCRGTLDKYTLMLQAMYAVLDRLLHLTNHSWPPEVLPVAMTRYDHGPEDPESLWHPFKAVTQ